MNKNDIQEVSCHALAQVQARLKAPKGQWNEFSKFKYRSCEDILEALKPVLADVGAALVLSDELIAIDGWHYVKATATFLIAGNGGIEACGWAREQESKKGMDASQITGSASSYARKYALNGLFLIDDTADADTRDNTSSNTRPAASTKRMDAPQQQPDNQDAANDRLFEKARVFIVRGDVDGFAGLWADLYGKSGPKQFIWSNLTPQQKEAAKVLMDKAKDGGTLNA